MPLMKLLRSRVGLGELFDARGALDELLEQHLHLHPGEVDADAVMRAAAAEGDMRVRVAVDVEGVRVFEHVFVTVG